MTSGNHEDFIDLEGMAAGDTDVLLCVYNLYRDRIYAFAYRMLGVQATAEDITHETFLTLIQNPEKYDPVRSSILTFLCLIARTRILKHFRRLGLEAEEGVDEQELHSIRDEYVSDPLSALLDRELETKVNEAIALLPPLQREVIILRKFQELSYYEISVITGTEVNVVKARLHRARQTLARKLAAYLKSKGEQYHEL